MGSDRGAEPGVHGLQASLLVELQAAVTALRWTDAGTAMDAFLTAHEAVHDGYRNVIARILSSRTPSSSCTKRTPHGAGSVP